MRAADVMTSEVVAVTPEAPIEEVVRLLTAHKVSALPVVDHDDRLVGVVSEGDLMRRPEIAGEKVLSWWLGLVASTTAQARDYVKAHGQTAGDVMTREVIAVAPPASLSDVVELMEKHRIRRTMVVEDDRLVGVVSRADLLQALVKAVPSEEAGVALGDDEIEGRLQQEIHSHGWDSPWLNTWVKDGVVHLAGHTENRAVRKALVVAARGIPGVKGVVVQFNNQTGWA